MHARACSTIVYQSNIYGMFGTELQNHIQAAKFDQFSGLPFKYYWMLHAQINYILFPIVLYGFQYHWYYFHKLCYSLLFGTRFNIFGIGVNYDPYYNYYYPGCTSGEAGQRFFLPPKVVRATSATTTTVLLPWLPQRGSWPWPGYRRQCLGLSIRLAV
jgi:hypothetical protein